MNDSTADATTLGLQFKSGCISFLLLLLALVRAILYCCRTYAERRLTFFASPLKAVNCRRRLGRLRRYGVVYGESLGRVSSADMHPVTMLLGARTELFVACLGSTQTLV